MRTLILPSHGAPAGTGTQQEPASTKNSQDAPSAPGIVSSSADYSISRDAYVKSLGRRLLNLDGYGCRVGCNKDLSKS